ncbi:hypothetical protein [Luteimonas sp. 100069]|uniref:hypothetical protein n=1 Tax=Luteimonas sp. 100069 TaxID=2006109 RepID=UPI000F4DCB4A|nr:hypothetical protein [Luteimonas sp. 100069]
MKTTVGQIAAQIDAQPRIRRIHSLCRHDVRSTEHKVKSNLHLHKLMSTIFYMVVSCAAVAICL